MSKLLIYTDVHWSTYSSIVRGRGRKYSARLENLIKSVSWAEGVAEERGCDAIFCLGDFFDKPTLNAEEISALNDVEWAKLSHTFLVGNHEIEDSNARYSSVEVLEDVGFNIVRDPLFVPIDELDLYIFPYTTNPETLNIKKGNNKVLVFSHNDVKGIRYGATVSQKGFDLEEINRCCDLFINGHLHNGERTGNLINLGNLTGQNFGEDAFRYSHNVMILDTKTLQYELIENPYAYNFYKVEFSGKKNEELCKLIESMKRNAVVTASIDDKQYETAKDLLEGKIYKLVMRKEELQEEEKGDIMHVDHFEKFRQCVFEKIGVSDLIKEEVEGICRV